MKKIFIAILVLLAVSVYGQTSISSNRIAGSSIVLNNLSADDVEKIMHGTIFDVFNLDLTPSVYNTDLKRLTFLETAKGQEYQEKLEVLKGRLLAQGIKIIPLSKSSTTRDYITTISDYDVNKRGFNIQINYNTWNNTPQRTPFGTFPDPNYTSNNIKGFKIPNIIFPYFMPVPINTAQKIEGNAKAVVQLQLDVNTFAIQKVFIINMDTLEVYAEVDYEK